MKKFNLFGKRKYRSSIYSLYSNIVNQARTESFYTLNGVPDTVAGRFDMITLHMYIVLRRLKEIGNEGIELSQDLFDIMFADMDKNMREMGVGDLSVGKNVKVFATAFYGRIKAYDNGISALKSETLSDSLKRNIFSDAEPREEQVIALEDYLTRGINISKNWSFSDIETNNIKFSEVFNIKSVK
jgi:cytochrome b pre-mRNA-processing protein 3